MKSILLRIFNGVKKGYQFPTLPDHLIQFNMHPLVRIFRFIGGLSILLVITHRLDFLTGNYYFFALVVCLFFIFIFLLYHIYLTYHRFIHIYKSIKSGKLDIRNSPFDRFGSAFSKAFLCAKGLCDTVAPVGAAFGSFAAVDEVRKAKGLEPIFVPLLAYVLFPHTPLEEHARAMRTMEGELARKNMDLRSLQEMKDSVDRMEQSKELNKKTAMEVKGELSSYIQAANKESTIQQSKILSSVKQLEESRKNK